MDQKEKTRFFSRIQRTLPCTLTPVGCLGHKVQGKERFEFKVEFSGGAVLDFNLASFIAQFFMIDTIAYDGINLLDEKPPVHGVEFIPKKEPRYEFDFPRGTKEITIAGENIDSEEHYFIGNITSINGSSLDAFDEAMAKLA